MLNQLPIAILTKIMDTRYRYKRDIKLIINIIINNILLYYYSCSS